MARVRVTVRNWVPSADGLGGTCEIEYADPAPPVDDTVKLRPIAEGGAQDAGDKGIALSSIGPGFPSDGMAIQTIDGQAKLFRRMKMPPGGGYAATVIGAEMDADMAGHGGEAVAGYFVTRVRGKCGPSKFDDGVGVSATVHKENDAWMSAGHFDIYDRGEGGTAIGVNIEMPQTVKGNATFGMNIEPNPDAQVTAAFNIGGARNGYYNALIDTRPAGNVNYLMRVRADQKLLTRYQLSIPTYCDGQLALEVDGVVQAYIPVIFRK